MKELNANDLDQVLGGTGEQKPSGKFYYCTQCNAAPRWIADNEDTVPICNVCGSTMEPGDSRDHPLVR